MKNKKFDFEKIHPSNKAAFLDGILTALAFVWIGKSFRNRTKKA